LLVAGRPQTQARGLAADADDKGGKATTPTVEGAAKDEAKAEPPAGPNAKTTSIQPSLKDYVSVYRSVMDPKIVADVFGRRIAKSYVTIQVTVTNRNTQYQFLVHDVSLDVTSIVVGDALIELKARREQALEAGLSEGEVRELHQLQGNAVTEADKARLKVLRSKLQPNANELSSDELSLVRGVAEKGQIFDRRNMFLRYLRALGTIAGGVTGVTRFGSSFAPSVAAYNGPFITAFTDAFPDFTVNQMNRLSDSAYAANKIVAKQHSLVMVAFVPQGQFMSNLLRKQFWNDPTSIQKTIDFRNLRVLVDGVFITEVEDQQPAKEQPAPPKVEEQHPSGAAEPQSPKVKEQHPSGSTEPQESKK